MRHIGLSEVGVDTIRRAAKVHPICDLQIEYSLVSRGPEAKIFPVLAELGIAMTAYGVLSRGLLTGSKPSRPGRLPRAHAAVRRRERRDEPARSSTRSRAPRPRAASRRRSSRSRGCARRAPRTACTIVPTIGARTPQQLADALGALDARAHGRRGRRARGRRAGLGRRRHALPGAPDGAPRQREVARYFFAGIRSAGILLPISGTTCSYSHVYVKNARRARAWCSCAPGRRRCPRRTRRRPTCRARAASGARRPGPRCTTSARAA